VGLGPALACGGVLGITLDAWAEASL